MGFHDSQWIGFVGTIDTGFQGPWSGKSMVSRFTNPLRMVIYLDTTGWCLKNHLEKWWSSSRGFGWHPFILWKKWKNRNHLKQTIIFGIIKMINDYITMINHHYSSLTIINLHYLDHFEIPPAGDCFDGPGFLTDDLLIGWKKGPARVSPCLKISWLHPWKNDIAGLVNIQKANWKMAHL